MLVKNTLVFIRRNTVLVFLSLLLILSIGIALGTKSLTAEAATTNSIYITPTPISVKSGVTFAVSVRINPGTATDAVQATVSYDSTKLQYVSTGSALDTSVFSTQLQGLTATTGKLSFVVGNLTQPVTTDSPLAVLNFKSLVSSGSTSISMASGTTAASTNSTFNGNWLNPSLGNATVNFAAATVATCPTGQTGTPPNCVTPPVATCPTGQTGTPPNCVVPPVKTCATGQTGTYPNCVTPPVKTCATGQTGTYPNCVTPPTAVKACATGQTGTYPNCVTPQPTTATIKTTQPTVSIPVSETPVAVTNTKTSPSAPNLSIDKVEAQFNVATVAITTDTPTRAFIQFGTTTELSQKTGESELGTTHQLALDASQLAPGQTYYYSVIAEDANGNQTQTDVQTITTRGMYLKLHVTDKNGQPIKNTKVTLHSTPTTGTTDKNGYVVFNNVTPGSHNLVYTAGAKTYTQPLTVASTILTEDGNQSTVEQSYTIRYPVSQSPILLIFIVLIVCLLIAAIGVVLFIRNRRDHTFTPLPIAAASVTPLPTDTSTGEVAERARDLYFSDQQGPTNPKEGQDPWQTPPQK